MVELEKHKSTMVRFLEEDKPAFQSWLHSTFGIQLSKGKSLMEEIEQNERLVDAAEYFMHRDDLKPHEALAYAEKVQSGEVVDREEEDSDDEDSENENEGSAHQHEQATAADFEAYFEMMFGHMSEKQFRQMFGEGKEKVKKEMRQEFGLGSEEPQQGSRSEKTHGHNPFGGPSSHKTTAAKPSSSLKELYRKLAKDLHPDFHPHLSEREKDLWHSVQNAYKSGNLEKLETLNALFHVSSGRPDLETSLGKLKELFADLKLGIKAIQREIRDSRKEPSWNFLKKLANKNQIATLSMHIKADLEMDIYRMESRLEDLKMDIEMAKKSRNTRKKRSSRSQPDFMF